MVLARRGDEYSIRVGGVELMNSHNHQSEDELGRIACDVVKTIPDAIVLDVDNGPDELFEPNAKLYRLEGLIAAKRALVDGGALVVWSAFESPTFTRWLSDAGYRAECLVVKAYGVHHYIWLART